MKDERESSSLKMVSKRFTEDTVIGGGVVADEDGEAPRTSGADFYLQKINEMMALNDPSLGNEFKDLPEESEATDISLLTIEQKLKDRNPKTKQAGLEELSQSIDCIEESTIREEYFAAIVSILSLIQPELQKNGLSAVIKIVEKKNSSRWVDFGALIKTIIEKIVASMKPQVKKMVEELFVLVHKSTGKDAFFSLMKDLIFPRNIKAKAAIIRLLNDMNSMFGIHDFCGLKFWELISKNEDSNPVVRKEFVSFSIELHRWMGEGFAFKLVNLKKGLVDEIVKGFEEKKEKTIEEPLLPLLEEYRSKYTSSDSQAKNLDYDPYDESEAFDLFKEYNDKWVDKVLGEEKWLPKKEYTDELIQKLSIRPRLTGNYHSVMMMCKRLLDDSNMSVQLNGIKILGMMSKSLRKEMSRDGKTVVGWLLPRLKERKKVAEEVREALKHTVHYISPQDSIERYEELVSQKHKELKENVLEWLDWYVCNSGVERLEGFLSAFTGILTKMMEDGAIEIRNMNTKIITRLISVIGRKNGEMNKLMEKLPKVQRDKVEAGKKNEEVPAKGRLEVVEKGGSQNVVRKGEKRVVVPETDGRIGDLRLELNVDRAVGNLDGRGVTKEEIETMQNGQWKAKQEGLQDIAGKLLKSATESELESFAVILTVTMKLFKESNPNLLKEYLTIVENVVNDYGEKMPPKFLYTFAWFLVEKYGDVKFIDKQKAIIDSLTSKQKNIMLLSLCELLPSKNPIPKSYANILGLYREMIESDNQIVPKKETLTLCKEGCANSNPMVKEKSIDLICSVYKLFGEIVRKVVNELNPQMKKTVESKLEHIQPAEEEIDDNLPRKEISSQINKLSSKLTDIKWTVRKDALIEASKIIKSAGKITSKGLKDFTALVKQRLLDSNQMVSREALFLMLPYIKSLGSDFKSESRSLLPLVIPFLNDKLDVLRSTAKQVLDISQSTIGSDYVISLLVQSFTDPCPDHILKALEYLDTESNISKLRKTDLRSFSKSLCQTIIHKNLTVRTQAEKFLEKTISSVPKDVWYEAIRDYNPTTKQAAESILSKHFPQDSFSGSQLISDSSSQRYPATFASVSSKKMEFEQLPISVSMENSLLEKPYTKPKIQDFQTAAPSTNLSLPSSETDSDFLIFISYHEPKDIEILSVKEKLIRHFGALAAEKMMSNEQARLIESLSSLGLLRHTNPDRYSRLMNLVLGWMYIRVWDTTRKNLLDLLAEFLLSSLEEMSARDARVDVSTMSRAYHVFDRLVANHPQKDECFGVIQKFAQTVGRCGFRNSFFSLLIDLLDQKGCDPQLIGLVLTELADGVDLKKSLTIRNVSVLEKYTNGLDDIFRHEIYHFYKKFVASLGPAFFTVFNFKDRSSLQRVFDIKQPEGLQPAPTALALILQDLRSGSPAAQSIAARALGELVSSPVPSGRSEVASSAPLISEAVKRLSKVRFSEVAAQDHVSLLYNALFSCRDFTHSLGPATLYELMDSLLESLVEAYTAGKNVKEEEEVERAKKTVASLNSAVLTLIGNVQQNVTMLVLMDMLIVSQREYIKAQGRNGEEGIKSKMTVVVNCLMNIAKKMKSKRDAESVGLSVMIAKMEEFFWEFGDVEKSAQHKGLRTLLTRVCEVMGEEVWAFYDQSREKIAEEMRDERSVRNLIVGVLQKENKCQLVDALLYRRNSNSQIGNTNGAAKMDIETINNDQKENYGH